MRNITFCGWWLSNRTFTFAIATLTFVSGLLFAVLVFNDSNFGQRAAVLAHQAVENVVHATSHYQHTGPSRNQFDYESDSYCNAFPDPGNIVVVVKTGATEIHEKVPAQLESSLRCVAEPLIFSDLKQKLGPYEVHDVLSNVAPSEVEENPDFELYRLQKEYLISGRESDLPDLRNVPIAGEDWRTKGKSAAWGLDKYKFLHMIERSWNLAPEKEWYLFIEADTYLSWPNLLRWLPNLNAQKMSYFGNAIRIYEYREELYFGHGGAGVLLSGPAVRKFAVTHRGLANRWDSRAAKMWFGDYVLAAALHEELHLDITDALPSMTERDPTAVAFHQEIWCRPVLTLHHINPQLLSKLAHHERVNNGSSMLYRDVFLETFPQGFPRNRTNWDNLIEDSQLTLEVESTQLYSLSRNASGRSELADPQQSYRACALACERQKECMQFSFITLDPKRSEGKEQSESRCHLSRAFKLGAAKQPETGSSEEGSEESWMSGWMADRITKWVDGNRDCRVNLRDWPGVTT